MIALEYNIAIAVQDELFNILYDQCDEVICDYCTDNIEDRVDNEISPIWRIVKPDRHKL